MAISKALGWHDDDIKSLGLEIKNNVLTVSATKEGGNKISNSTILPSGGSGDITAAGDNTFTGSNIFDNGAGNTTFNNVAIFNKDVDLNGTVYLKKGKLNLGVNEVTFQDKEGIVALTSDIPAILDASYYVMAAGDNTFTGVNIFKPVSSEDGVKVVNGEVSTTYTAREIIHNTGTSQYSCSLPTKAGTIALMDDIPSFSFDSTTSTLSITLNS